MTEHRIDGEELVRAYYESLDDGAYDRLETLLSPDFVHYRPKMTLSDRAEFVQFMREERPRTDTTHHIDRVYRAATGTDTAVEGRLTADEETITGFVDLFAVADGQIEQIKTYID
jgi:ketosteroid isomerase-like protein